MKVTTYLHWCVTKLHRVGFDVAKKYFNPVLTVFCLLAFVLLPSASAWTIAPGWTFNTGEVTLIDHLVVSPASTSVTSGSTVTYTTTAYDSVGASLGVVDAVYSISSGASGSWSGSTYLAANTGTWTVTATYSNISSSASLTVTSPVSGPVASDSYHVVFLVKNGSDVLSDGFVMLGTLHDSCDSNGEVNFYGVAAGTYHLVVLVNSDPVYGSNVVVKGDALFTLDVASEDPPEIDSSPSASPSGSPFVTAPPIIDLSGFDVSSYSWVLVAVVIFVVLVLFFGLRGQKS